ncbi:MAG: GspH/FimT family pseudopilin [Desulfococcaceae bacterium]
MKRVRGFTLLELLVVVGLMSLMAGMVVPRMAGSLDRMNARTAARKVSAALRYARSRAAAEQIVYVAILETKENRLLIGPPPKENSEFIDANPQPGPSMKSFSPPRGARFQWVAETENRWGSEREKTQILFFPSGGSSGGKIRLVDDAEREYTVEVDRLTGLAEVLDE